MLVRSMCHTQVTKTHTAATPNYKTPSTARHNQQQLSHLPACALYRPRLMGPFELSGMTDKKGIQCCHLLFTCENAPTKSNQNRTAIFHHPLKTI